MTDASDAPDVEGLTARRLDDGALPALTELCARCTDFFALVEGEPGGDETAREILVGLPPGKDAASKHVFGFFSGEPLAAVVDVIEAFPDDATWYVSLMLVDPAFRGRGLGRAIWDATWRWLRARGGTRARLIVQRQNPRAREFWESVGFAVVEETVQKLPTRENRVWRLLKA